MSADYDAIVVGGGHNGLVAAIFLARAGLRVAALEKNLLFGGACRTEYPFAAAPKLGASTGAYLLGPMPPELLESLGLNLKLLRRDPYYFLPTRGKRSLLLGHDDQLNRAQFEQCFSEADWSAHVAMQRDLARIRDAVAPSWLEQPRSLQETADRYLAERSDRQLFTELCRGSVMEFLDRYGFKSDLLKAMYAVTDGLIGAYASWDTPGTGLNFLLHNMCRLPASNGTWMLVEGGMGKVTAELCRVALEAGVELRASSPVAAISSSASGVDGVALANGEVLKANVVVSGADPFSTRRLIGDAALPPPFLAKLDEFATRPGATMKVNLCLRKLPRFTCMPEDRGQFFTTTHLLPDESEVLDCIQQAFRAVTLGELPDYPLIEWYTHTKLDPTLQDSEGRHNAALFVQLVPNRLATGSWDDAVAEYVRKLLAIVDEFAPGTSELVEEHFTLTPEGIERHFGIAGGHIMHVDMAWGFENRLPFRSPIAGLYFAGAACHPGGGVTGAPGFNAAQAVLQDLGK